MWGLVVLGGLMLLRQTSLRVTECLNKAVEARLLHDAETSLDNRLTYLQVEQCWNRLAQCYELMDQLEALMKAKPRWRQR
jgi:hypothetical protein